VLVRLPVVARLGQAPGVMAEPTSPLCQLRAFRAELHACRTRRADALFELADALLCAEAMPSLPHLSLEAVHQRGWAAPTPPWPTAVWRSRRCATCWPTIRSMTASRSTPSMSAPGPAVTPRPAPNAASTITPPAIRPGSRSWPAGRSSGSASSASPATAGPPRSTPPACTRPTTTTRPPSPRSAPSSPACLPPIRRCRCLCSMPVTTRAASASAWPGCPPRSWSGCAPGAGSTPTRHRGLRPARAAGRAATAPSSTPATQPPGSPSATHTEDDGQYGAVTVQAWAGLHPKQQLHPNRGTKRPRPIARGTLVRVQVQRIPARTRPPKVLWLWWQGPGEPDLGMLWRAYVRRFDCEHSIRFAKQTLGWTTPRVRHPEQAERWTWLVLAAYTQLRLARTAVSDRRLPCQRPQAAHRLTPYRVRRGFRSWGACSARRPTRRNPAGALQAGRKAAAPAQPGATRRSRRPPEPRPPAPTPSSARRRLPHHAHTG
jgi:hypothetical protein